jgi:hypothetical protein
VSSLVLGLVLCLTLSLLVAGPAGAQQGAAPQEGGSQMAQLRQRLQRIHTPQSVDEELDRLTKDLSLTPRQREHVRTVLNWHHEQIQALLDSHPELTVEQFRARTHEISDQTHAKIGAMLTPAQQEAVKAMLDRMHSGLECRRACSSLPGVP